MEMSTRALFDQISSQDCQKMYGCMEVIRRKYKSGELIYTFQNNQGQIGIIEKGSAWMERIDIDGNSSMLDHLEEGEIFGEIIAFANQCGKQFQVVCEHECTVAYVPYKKIITPCGKVCECHQRMIENLLAIISEKAQNLSERIEIISNRSIRTKLLYYFQIQVAKAGVKSFRIPFSVTTLSEYLCVDRSAMAREIGKMKEEGILEMHRRDVTLLN
ncbi:MAG: Crp/Fnr family transcriptional regulator [Hespellia sp.]|nr:Crp/Fnr family transcriptional regulator [Hespellia sp.]